MRRVFSVLILSSKPLVTQKAASQSLPGRTIVSEIVLSLRPFGADAHPANIITIRKREARMVAAPGLASARRTRGAHRRNQVTSLDSFGTQLSINLVCAIDAVILLALFDHPLTTFGVCL